MKIAPPSAQPSRKQSFVYHRPTRPKPRPKGPQRWVAPIVGATLLSSIIGASIATHYSPALLTNAGDFVWSIKSSLAELLLVLFAARVPKHH